MYPFFSSYNTFNILQGLIPILLHVKLIAQKSENMFYFTQNIIQCQTDFLLYRKRWIYIEKSNL